MSASRKAIQPTKGLTIIERNDAVRAAHAALFITLPPGSKQHYLPIAGAEPLRRCPFCDNSREPYVKLEGHDDELWALVECGNCGSRGPEADAGSEGDDDTIHGKIVEAVRMWNQNGETP